MTKLVYYWRYRDCVAKIQTTVIKNIRVPDDKGKPFRISDHCYSSILEIIECKQIKNYIKRKAPETEIIYLL